MISQIHDFESGKFWRPIYLPSLTHLLGYLAVGAMENWVSSVSIISGCDSTHTRR